MSCVKSSGVRRKPIQGNRKATVPKGHDLQGCHAGASQAAEHKLKPRRTCGGRCQLWPPRGLDWQIPRASWCANDHPHAPNNSGRVLIAVVEGCCGQSPMTGWCTHTLATCLASCLVRGPMLVTADFTSFLSEMAAFPGIRAWPPAMGEWGWISARSLWGPISLHRSLLVA